MSTRFGFDFAGVRIHDDSRASASARAVGALAYTVGSDVVFTTGHYDPASMSGARLLAHELTHVVQQSGSFGGSGRQSSSTTGLRMSNPADAAEQEAVKFATHTGTGLPVVQQSASGAPTLQRGITEDSIKAKDGDFYSTHCGWVDTGHANPKLARGLIAFVREASQRIERREKVLADTLNAEAPGLVSETAYPASYEKNEQAESANDAPVMIVNQHPSGAVDIFLGGFGVNSSDAAKFAGIVQTIADTHAGWEALRGRKFGVEVWGFSDCIGHAGVNDKLRRARALAISSALRGASKDITPSQKTAGALTDFAASNSTRAGRRQNRGVLIRMVPRVTPEKFGTPTMESRKWGARFSAVTPQAELKRSLSEDEILSVALTIFQAQSRAFEVTQSWRDEIPFAPPSSMFAEEDMPSNLIGFYRAARGFSIDEVRSVCGAWDQKSSLDKVKGYEFKPNPTFQPQRLPPGGVWPDEFCTITPAPFNGDAFRILQLKLEVPLLDVELDCSVDANTGSLKCP